MQQSSWSSSRWCSASYHWPTRKLDGLQESPYILLTMTRLIVATLAAAAALAPSPVKPAVVARRDVAAIGASFAAAVALPAFADDAPAAAPPAEDEAPAPVEFPKDWGITSDYYTDAAKVVAHMRLATSLEKGAPNMEMIALNCKKEMIDFVARGA